jgi:hypothetical protein
MTVADSVDGSKMTWDQAMTEAWSTNVKAMFEQHLRDGEREREQKNLSDALAQRVAEQQNALVSLIQTNAATLANRTAQNAATVDHLANIGGLAQLSEYRNIGAQVAEQASEAATAAINSALAQGAQSNPVAQGTAGLAQGAVQAGIAGVNVALLSNLAEVIAALGVQVSQIKDALGVILVKVVGEEVTA